MYTEKRQAVEALLSRCSQLHGDPAVSTVSFVDPATQQPNQHEVGDHAANALASSNQATESQFALSTSELHRTEGAPHSNSLTEASKLNTVLVSATLTDTASVCDDSAQSAPRKLVFVPVSEILDSANEPDDSMLPFASSNESKESKGVSATAALPGQQAVRN